MFAFRAALAVAALALPAAGLPPSAGARLGVRHEPGVETRLPLTLVGRMSPLPRLSVAGALGADLSRSPLPDRFGFEAGWALPIGPGPDRLGLAAGAVLRRWPEWRVGENVAFLSARAAPTGRLALEAGVAWRVPVHDTLRWRSPLAWSGPLAELNAVYGIGWQVIARPELELSVRTGNRDRLALRTPHLVGIRVEGTRRLGRGWVATAALAGEVKGVTAVLASFGAAELELGVCREF